MSRTYKNANGGNGRQRRISVRGVRWEEPDVRKLGRALLQLAMEQAAAEAAAEASQPTPQAGLRQDASPPEAEDA